MELQVLAWALWGMLHPVLVTHDEWYRDRARIKRWNVGRLVRAFLREGCPRRREWKIRVGAVRYGAWVQHREASIAISQEA
jgi:hypothetical protein